MRIEFQKTMTALKLNRDKLIGRLIMRNYKHLILAGFLAGAILTGCSEESETSAETTTATAPDAPTNVAASAGDASAIISFSAPASDGGADITSYTVTCAAGSASQSASAGDSPITVDGLTNGETYECSVTATNSVGTSSASASASVTPAEAVSTAGVDCPYSGSYTGTYSTSGTLTAMWSWTCSTSIRNLTGNGLPDHEIGTFPSSADPHAISEQVVSANITLEPSMSTTTTEVSSGSGFVYARNSVKFDPATAATCPSTADDPSDCSLRSMGMDQWRIEALGQSVFDFGDDMNNAHVQPSGEYHYHGIPEGILINAGVDDTNPAMVHVGWAADGYPVYARYCYDDSTDATSNIKRCEGSFELDTVADTGRPDTSWVPLGAFTSDWNYVEGSGDLDECNGRFGVTPEFPDGIYYYMATDTYPYFSRCLKGNL